MKLQLQLHRKANLRGVDLHGADLRLKNIEYSDTADVIDLRDVAIKKGAA